MNRPGNFFDLATAVFFIFFLLKLVFIGVRELKRERQERFAERPATWLQYSQPPLMGIMILLVYAAICTNYFRLVVPARADLLLKVTGMLLTVAGIVLSAWAMRSIGKDMQSDIALNKGHVLRTDGAYSLVRHPMYLSLILLCLGAGFATLNLLLTGFALFVLAPVQFLRARKEEDLFVRHFGTAYASYRKKTPMMLPGRLR